jgi:renalase
MLQARGVETTVFDKGRAPGGRVSTRRASPHTFDLGAQYFTARTPEFLREVRAMHELGHCAPWTAQVVAIDDGACRQIAKVERWVGVPGMSQIARSLAHGVNIRCGHRVDRIHKKATGLQLVGAGTENGNTLGPTPKVECEQGTEDLGVFDGVLVCLPAPQAVALVDGLSLEFSTSLGAVEFEPCFSVGLSVPGAAGPALPFDAAFIGRKPHAGSALAWVARDSGKPARPPGERWVLHANPTWSRQNLGADHAWVGNELLQAFRALPGASRIEAEVCVVHRWLLARPAVLDAPGTVLFDAALGLGAAGDWSGAGTVEAAYLAGVALAERVLGQTRAYPVPPG